jgi:hypothetical protein
MISYAAAGGDLTMNNIVADTYVTYNVNLPSATPSSSSNRQVTSQSWAIFGAGVVGVATGYMVSPAPISKSVVCASSGRCSQRICSRSESKTVRSRI